MFKSLQKDNVCKRQKPRVKRYKATHWVVLHCGSTIIRGVARKIPEVNKKSQIFHHPGCIAIYLPLPLLNVTEIQFWKKIRTKTCKRQKNLPKQCTVIPFTNKHWVSLYNVLEMIRSYPTRGWKQYLTHSPASGYVSLRSFVHSWRLSQIWKQRSHGNRIVRTAKWQQLQMQCVADGQSLIKVSIFYNQSMIHTL